MALGVAALSAVLYATTFSSRVAWGDAPESVAGVKTVGILHAPGYPSYVLAARLFGTVVAIGSWSLRTNLFSLVCASATVAAVYLIARLFGASPVGSVIGAFALATAASFWLNADFAKHYPWTALLLALAILFVALWQDGRSDWWLVGAALAIAADVGSGWQLAVIVACALVAMVTIGERSPSNRALVLTGGAFVVGVLAIGTFVLVRASQDPTLNWGDASNLARLGSLVARNDFQGVNTTNASFFGRFAGRAAGVVRDFGWVAAALAVVGIAAWRRLRREVGAFLLIAGLGNLLAVAIDRTVGYISGFASVVVQGGYMLLAMIGGALLVALGVTVSIEWISARVASRSDDGAPGRARVVAVVAAVVIAALVLGPSISVHRAHADLRAPPLADNYAKRVLAALPPHAVLLVWNEEFMMPMIKRQLVDGERRDVTVLAPNSLRLGWARDQIARRLHLGKSLNQADLQTSIVALAAALFKERPLYLDPEAMFELHNLIAFQPQGVVGKVVKGDPGPHKVANLSALSSQLEQADRADGLTNISYDRFPFTDAFFLRGRAHLELAKAYALNGDRNGTDQELHRALGLLPDNPAVLAGLHRVQTARAASFY
ncbi:MAG TPA: DUF2723 domain-containing protein, partial [Acidimicrobiia bacterium]